MRLVEGKKWDATGLIGKFRCNCKEGRNPMLPRFIQNRFDRISDVVYRIQGDKCYENGSVPSIWPGELRHNIATSYLLFSFPSICLEINCCLVL